jgi:glycosyltransferase involved in cell wall biosynthesis
MSAEIDLLSWEEQTMTTEREEGWDKIERLGYPGLRPPPAPPAARWALAPEPAPPLPGVRRNDVGLVTIATLNYLHHVRALFHSLRALHPDVDAVVVVVDWDGNEDLELEGAQPWTLEALAMDRPDFLRLKFGAAHLCYAVKPAAIRAMARRGYRKILYFDADIHVYARLDALLAALDRYRFVVLPHTVGPMPNPERLHEMPALGDLAAAGMCNAGLLGLVPDAESMRFVDQWEEMVLAPGAFRFHQAEQNALNWVLAFLEGSHVFRDTAYNVAYWNLHDRSLRWQGLDGGDAGAWQVDGRPLVAFHFSGLPFERPAWLSVHDTRHSLYVLPSASQLVEDYVRRLLDAGALACRQRGYAYDRFPSGVPIDERMRRCFRDHELFWGQDVEPFTPEGETYFCRRLFLPTPDTFLVPALVWAIHLERGDTHVYFPDARISPAGLLTWFITSGCREYGYLDLFDRHRPAVPRIETALHLAHLFDQLPVAFRDLAAPCGADRQEFARRAELAALPEAPGIRGCDGEIWPLTPLWLVWRLVEERPDLRPNFPDLLGEHAGHLADWLEGDGVRRHGLPPGLGANLLRRVGGRSLARLLSFLRRNRRLMERFPLALIGVERQEFATALLRQFPADCEFDLDDVVFYLWQMAERPSVGLAATLDLPVHQEHRLTTVSAPAMLLGPYLGRIPGLGEELARLGAGRAEAEGCRLLRASRHARVVLPEMIPHPAVGHAPEAALGPGINCFGYFKSPIGLGSLSRGLEQALLQAGWAVQRNVVGNMMMQPDLELADLVDTYRHEFDTNLLVSYPHLHEDLLGVLPPALIRGRRNVVYLAWEQRDGHPWWRQVFAEYDQVWALSTFAAEALSRFSGRPVLAVPPLVDFEAFPPAATKAEVGLDPDKKAFLYVFDANSSIERKNPEAAIAAFARAFAPGEKVQLVIKASNADRLEHRRRLLRLMAAGHASGHDVRWIFEHLPRPDLLRLVSAVDAYVSLHRAEGFGYTCAEAMAYRVPVIATGYSGNMDFMDAESAFLVDWREREVEVSDGPFQRGSVWAEPDVEHAAALMRAIVDDPARAAEVGARGQQMARERLSATRVAQVVAEALRRG